MPTSVDLLVCVVCRTEFDLDNKLPLTQACQHSICRQCSEERDLHKCPLDGMQIDQLTQVNWPLANFLYGQNHTNASNNPLGRLALWLRVNIDQVSPQQKRKLLQLITSTHFCSRSRPEFIRRLATVFNRLLLELIQAHYNTKQREQDVIREVEQVGCSIHNPDLTDTVIQLLIKLYKAANQCTDTSFERKVLIKFLFKELGEQGAKQRQIEKIVQTLYRCSCFDVIVCEGASSRLKLKAEFRNEFDLRQQHDTEIIKIATSHQIRLPPERWAYLLTERSNADSVSRMQSILDKCQNPPTVEELQTAISKVGDKYNLNRYLNNLRIIQELLDDNRESDSTSGERKIVLILERLTNLTYLFSIRQSRGSFRKH